MAVSSTAAEVQTKFSVQDAHARLVMLETQDLAEMCCESHKDFNGFKGRWLLSSPHSILTTWWFQHFSWNESTQIWEPTRPFIDE